MSGHDVKFGEWIQRGIDLYKDNLVSLVLASIVTVAVSCFTFFVLAGPMMAGLTLMVLALHDGRVPKPEVGDLFKGFNFFVPTLVYALILGVVLYVGSFLLGLVPLLGPVLSLAYGYTLLALTMFVLFNIVDRRMDVGAAVQSSVETVKANFWPFLGFSVVASIIGGLGLILCGVGVVLTLPIHVCILTVAYRDLFGGATTDASVAG